MDARRLGQAPRDRRGNSLALFALLSPVIVGSMALSVDTAVMATARSQLSTVADAAALAGARQLASPARLKGAPVGAVEITAGQAQAIATADANRVLGAPAVLRANAANANTPAADLVFGYLVDPSNPSNEAPNFKTDSAALPSFNTLLIRARRSADHGGQVPSFFGRVLGAGPTDVTVLGAATVLGFVGFRSVGNAANANLLPITLDLKTYRAMIAGLTTDQYSYNATTAGVGDGADGVAESKLYPVATGSPGNWGTINVGVSSNSTSTLGAQIRYGITPAQLATFPGGQIRLDPATQTITFTGDPGISAGLKDDLTSIIGRPVNLPIYDPDRSGGSGNTMNYTVVAFAPVRIVAVNFHGSNKYVIVQPAEVPDHPTDLYDSVTTFPDTRYRLVLTR